MLPIGQNFPSLFSKFPSSIRITFSIGFNLIDPESAIGFWWFVVPSTSVPEASMYKNSYFGASKNDICSPVDFGYRS